MFNHPSYHVMGPADEQLPPPEDRLPSTDELSPDENTHLTKLPADLDSFYSQMYTYWSSRGLSCVIINAVSSLIRSITVLLILVLFVYLLNWEELVHCHAEACAKVPWMRSHSSRSAAFENRFLGLILFVLCVHFLLEILFSLRHVLTMRKCSRWFRTVLHLEDEDLAHTSWSIVARALTNANQRHGTKYSVHTDDELLIAQRILRFENYLVWITADEELASTLFGSSRLTRPLEVAMIFLLRRCFDTQRFRFLPRDVMIRVMTKWCMWGGIVMLGSAPVILGYRALTAMLRYGVEVRTEPSKVTLRRWTTQAKWVCRDFNELPDVLESRLQEAYPVVGEFRTHLNNELYNSICRLVVFLASSVAAVAMVLSVVNAGLLTNVMLVGEFNLLWFMSIAIAIASAARACIIDGPAVTARNPHEALRRVQQWLHHRLAPWRTSVSLTAVERDLSLNFHVPALLYFIQEMWGILMLPYVLMCPLCSNVPQLVDAILQCTPSGEDFDDRVGDCCGYASFNFSKYGRKKFGARRDGEAHIMSARRRGADKFCEKMVVSVLNFACAHPQWTAQLEPSDDEKNICAVLERLWDQKRRTEARNCDIAIRPTQQQSEDTAAGANNNGDASRQHLMANMYFERTFSSGSGIDDMQESGSHLVEMRPIINLPTAAQIQQRHAVGNRPSQPLSQTTSPRGSPELSDSPIGVRPTPGPAHPNPTTTTTAAAAVSAPTSLVMIPRQTSAQSLQHYDHLYFSMVQDYVEESEHMMEDNV
eukprot:PhM_4_TR8623/c0_g1_i1/m.22079/K17907/ATG9; autophagy-related protein 9